MYSKEPTSKSSRPRREAGASLREWREELVQGELLPILAQIERISLGERGEKAVGAALDELQSEQYLAVHAIRASGYDIDHVLIGPGGVFVIETKYSRGRGMLTFRNGQGLFIGERPHSNKAIKQAKAGAGEVARLIEQRCGLSQWVWPLVVFVGNWIVADQWESTDVRVFTPESLKSYIRQRQPILKLAEIESIASHLERSIGGAYIGRSGT